MTEDRKDKHVTSVDTGSKSDTGSKTEAVSKTGTDTETGSAGPAADAAVNADTPGTSQADSGQPYLRHVAIGLSVVVLVFAVLVGWLAYGARADAAAEAARTEARVAAEEQAVAMLAYDFDEVDDQIALAGEGLTGDFRDEYTNLMKNVIAPGAKEKAISVQVSVQGSSVVSADTDSAVTLLFLNQITTSSENPEAVSSGSRVRVELEKHDDRWLVSRLTPI